MSASRRRSDSAGVPGEARRHDAAARGPHHRAEEVREKDKASPLRDILLPNRAWNRRAMASGQPPLYWALHIALAIAAVVLIMCFGIQQQRALQ
jgi:hypothetical protein